MLKMNNIWQLIKNSWEAIPFEKAQPVLTFITAIITLYLSVQAHQIKKEIDLAKIRIDQATFVSNLLENLIAKDKTIKSDISLIVLNRLMSQNPEEKLMVAEIAEQIYRENLREAQIFAKTFDQKNNGKNCNMSMNTNFSTSAVAFKVLEENYPKKAKSLLKELFQQKTFEEGDKRTDLQKTCVEQLERYYNVLNYVVYLHFNDQKKRSEITKFGNKLKKIGWTVPNNQGVIGELHCSGYTWLNDNKPISTVRYYHISDKINAKRIQNLANKFFKKDFHLDDLSLKYPDTAFGQIELWIYYDNTECNNQPSPIP